LANASAVEEGRGANEAHRSILISGAQTAAPLGHGESPLLPLRPWKREGGGAARAEALYGGPRTDMLRRGKAFLAAERWRSSALVEMNPARTIAGGLRRGRAEGALECGPCARNPLA
jgi:hypothetical protein